MTLSRLSQKADRGACQHLQLRRLGVSIHGRFAPRWHSRSRSCCRLTFGVLPSANRRLCQSSGPLLCLPGTVVGGYQIVKKLAAGGFGVVYLAEDSKQPSGGRSRSTCLLRWPNEHPGELTPRVKPEKQPLYRPWAQELLRRRAARSRRFQPPERGVGAELLPRERNRLHGDELSAGRHPAGFHRHRARSEARQGVSRVDHPQSLFDEDPARPAHRAPAQDAAPGHQAGQHLHHQRQQGGDARLRRSARGAEQGGQLHPPDVHAAALRPPRCTAAMARSAPGPTSTPSAPASMPACRAIRPTMRRSASRKTAWR